jgi:hypothetical protein
LYASVTDYTAVYNDTYRDRRGSHTSFDIRLLPSLLASFCREAGVSALLDVSGGQGRLAEALGDLGIDALTTDLAAAPGRPVIAFDLSCYSEPDVVRVRQRAERAFRGAPHVTCCLDVLEHVDREQVFAAVRNLAGLTASLLVVSFSTRPSSRDNLFHASIFPISTWIRVFEILGFRLLPTSLFAPATRRLNGQNAADPLVDRWQAIDLFGDTCEGEPRYLILEKTADAPDWGAVNAEVEELLDVAYRREKRRQFLVPENSRFVLSLHHIQEFSFLRALLDVLPRQATRVILRPYFIEDGHRRAITGFLARTGVRTHVYERAEELPWSELAGSILVSAAESTCAPNHVHGLQISALARLHGCRTYLLQHGIWPRNFPGRVVTFGSELVLNWGAAEERILQQNEHRLAAVDVPWGVFHPGQVRRIGSPRYTDQLLPVHPDCLALRLGIERDRFVSVALLATKRAYRSSKPEVDAAFHTAMRRLIETHPEMLFLIRPHPAHGEEDLSELQYENVRVLDETCCIAADIPLNRIIPLVDQVIAPISTVALDGAISDKPVLVYDAAQPQTYDHLEAVRMEQLPEVVGRSEVLSKGGDQARLFQAAYAEAVDTRFYEHFARLLAEPAASVGKPDAALATAVSLTAEVEQQWCEAQRARTEASQLGAKLETESAAARGQAELLVNEATTARNEAEVLRKEAATLRRELDLAQRRIKRMRRSLSWRITKPLRILARAMRHLTLQRVTSSRS